MEESEHIKSFLVDSSQFIDEFKPTFVKYFVDLCISYDKFYAEHTLEEVASTVYEDIFVVDIFITTFENDIFKEMLKDGVMIGFLINRSMFFLLENYIKSINESEKSKGYVESMILCITEYINEFEKNICDKNRLQPLHINFDKLENFSECNNILDIFKDIKERGDEITFFNLYKGIPVEHKATIVDIDGEDVVFRTMQTQEMAMKMDGVAYILKDGNFDKYLKANISYNNFANNTVVLNGFTYLLNMPATNREFMRVHPEIMAEVSLSYEDELMTKGKLFDLSIYGLGVVSEENNGIYAGAKIRINFELKYSNLDKSTHLSIDGEILNIIEYSSSYRYCIKIYPKANAEDKIREYVKIREVEILDSLNKEIESYKM